MHRRRFLAATASALPLSVAGCVGSGDDPADRENTDDRTRYDWAVDPDVLEGGGYDGAPYEFRYASLETLRDHEDELDEEFAAYYRELVASQARFTIDSDEFDARIAGNGFIVYLGSIDTDAVGDSLRTDGYTETDTGRYLNADLGYAVGVTEEYIVQGRSGAADAENGDTAVVDVVEDTASGERDRYRDAYEDFDAVADALGDGTITSAAAHPPGGSLLGTRFDHHVGTGAEYAIEGKETAGRVVLVFEDEEAREQEEGDGKIDEYLEEPAMGPRVDQWRDQSITVNGRIVRIEGIIDTAALTFPFGM